MTDAIIYYNLEPLDIDACDLTKDAYAEARRSWLCTGCCAPKPSSKPIDAWLQDAPPKKGKINFVNGCGLGVAYVPFLARLGNDIIRADLIIGRVYGPQGKLLPDWVTFRGRKKLIVRGTENAGNRRCSECGSDVYFAMGDRYLYPMPPADASVFETLGGGLVVSKNLFEKLNLKESSELRIDELPVLDAPKDGLGELNYL